MEGHQDCGDALEEGDVSDIHWARPVHGISAPGHDAVRDRATVIHEGCELEKALEVGVSDRSVCVRVRVPVEMLGDDPVMTGEQRMKVSTSVRAKLLFCFLFVLVLVIVFVVRQLVMRSGSSGKYA